ncbi:MAG: hypothetical protein HN642_07885 [Methylococcales bacterium]|jgi:hypothetical protein|nr:hypothetical protein [Methylococcales bacterium]
MILNTFTNDRNDPVHNHRDYFIAAFTFISVAGCLISDGSGSQQWQYALGVFAWFFLFCLLMGETVSVRMQVIVAVAFATVGENFASPYLGGYIYRFENVPAYVPPGHGMVYLTALALSRSGLFLRYARELAIFVLIVCGLWSLWGLLLAERLDLSGALLYVIFVAFLFKGQSPLLYLAAFFITTWLEIIGTVSGTWQWAPTDPVLHWSQGNPPSGVAAMYCLVDAVAINGAPGALKLMAKLTHRYPIDRSHNKYRLFQYLSKGVALGTDFCIKKTSGLVLRTYGAIKN